MTDSEYRDSIATMVLKVLLEQSQTIGIRPEDMKPTPDPKILASMAFAYADAMVGQRPFARFRDLASRPIGLPAQTQTGSFYEDEDQGERI